MQLATGIDLLAARGSSLAWWPHDAVYAADFANHRYMKSGRHCTSGDVFAVARDTASRARDSNGYWHEFAASIPARTDLGLFISNAATNGIRNSAMTGAVAGSPGHLPYLWTFVGGSGIDVCEVTGTGTSHGLPYIDIKIAGVTTAASGIALAFDTHGVFSAGKGDDATFSFYGALIAGSLEGVDIIRTRLIEHSADGSVVHTHYPPPMGEGLDASIQRFSMTREVHSLDAASLSADLVLTFGNGQALDLTLRIAAPQLEEGVEATAPILSSGTLGFRDADTLTLHLPPGSHDLVISFADAAPQVIAGVGGDLVLGRDDLGSGHIVSATALVG